MERLITQLYDCKAEGARKSAVMVLVVVVVVDGYGFCENGEVKWGFLHNGSNDRS